MNFTLLDSPTTTTTIHNSLVCNNDIVDEQFHGVEVTLHF